MTDNGPMYVRIVDDTGIIRKRWWTGQVSQDFSDPKNWMPPNHGGLVPADGMAMGYERDHIECGKCGCHYCLFTRDEVTDVETEPPDSDYVYLIPYTRNGDTRVHWTSQPLGDRAEKGCGPSSSDREE